MSQCPTIYIQLSIISKWLAKHISTISNWHNWSFDFT